MPAPTLDDLFGAPSANRTTPSLDDLFGPSAAPRINVSKATKVNVLGTPRVESFNAESRDEQGRTKGEIARARARTNQANEETVARVEASRIAATDDWGAATRKTFENMPERAKSWIGGLGVALSEMGALANPDVMTEAFGSPTTQADLDREFAAGSTPGSGLYKDAQTELAANPVNYRSKAQFYVLETVNAAAELAAATGASIVTRSPSVGSSMMGARVFGDRYAESRAQGRSSGEAFGDASFYAVAEAIPERMALGVLMKPGGKFVGRVAKGAAAEAVQESVTEILQTGYDVGVLDESMTWGEAVARVRDSAIIGGLAGGSISAGVAGLDGFRKRAVSPDVPGISESAAVAAPVTEADIASPIPTDIIAEGKALIGGAQGASSADSILKAAGVPSIGRPVSVTMPDGRIMSGVVQDAFETDAGDLGTAQGVKIKLEDGSTFAEHFDTLAEAGVKISELGPLAEADALDSALATMAQNSFGDAEAITSLKVDLEPVAKEKSTGKASIDGGIVSFLLGKGLSAAQARGIAAGIEAESRSDHTIVNPTSGAFGLGQWLGPRKAMLFKRYGNNPTRDEQLEFLHWELTGGDHGGKSVLAAQGEVAALQAYILKFMRPARGAETEGDLSRGTAALGLIRDPAGSLESLSGPDQQGSTDSAKPEQPFSQAYQAGRDLAGDDIDGDWTRFKPESGTLDIPRDTMPQIKAEARGALVNFLNARNITSEEDSVPATSLKPTQAEFSKAKVQKAADFDGGDRAILVSSDGHVLDGHHQWLAKRDAGEDVRVIRLNAPIKDLLDVVPEMPSVTTADGGVDAAPASDVAASIKGGGKNTESATTGNLTLEDRPGGKSIILRGLTQSKDDEARLRSVLPEKALPTWNAQAKGWVVAKKHEDRLRGLIAAQTVKISDTLAGGVKVEDAAKAAREREEHPGLIVKSLQTGKESFIQPKGTVQPQERTQIGENVRGDPVFEDGRGVRSFTRNGVRRSETVSLGPPGSGEISVNASERNEDFLTVKELKAQLDANPRPSGGGSVDLVYVSRAGTQVRNLIPGRDADKPNLAQEYRKAGEKAFAAGEPRIIPDALNRADVNERIRAAWYNGWDQANIDSPTEPVAREGRTADAVEAKPAASANAPDAPASTYGSGNKVFTQDAAEKARALLRSKLNQINSGFDPEVAQAGLTLMGYHIEAGARAFMEASRAVAQDLGVTPSDLKNSLRSWYASARMWMEDNGQDVGGMDDDATVKVDLARIDQWGAAPAPSAPDRATSAESADIPTAIADYLAGGGAFQSIVQARKFIAERTGEKIETGTVEAKRADEAIEAGIVMAARKIAEQGLPPLETYRAMVDLYARQPSLNVRTSTSIEQQAYSTPMPLAYLASQRAGITLDTTVYEPSAGNGALLVGSDSAKVVANELNPERADWLEESGIAAGVSRADATAFTPPGGPFDVVIANPPFGPIKDETGENRVFDMGGGYETREIDHAIALRALDSMKDDGGAVLIVGGLNKTIRSDDGRSDAYNSKAKREFYLRLYSEYNVTDHFTVAGELYAKQGAGWPVDVIVIEGRGKSALRVPAADVPRQYGSWAELEDTLNGRPGPTVGEPGREAGNPAGQGSARGPAVLDGRSNPDGSVEPTDRPRLDQTRPDGAVEVRSGLDPRQSERERVDINARGEDANVAPNDRVANSDRPTRVKRDAPKVEGANARQVAYAPASTSNSLGTLVPVNMQTAIREALDALEGRVGPVDVFVADRLGYDVKEIGTYFAAEQVDALALALDNMERGAGFIIGDQCVAGETLIYDPIAKTETSIAALAIAGQPITVLSLTRRGFEARSASAPFLKGTTDLFRVTLDDGSSIVVTEGHRFLSPDGWVSLRSGVYQGVKLVASSSIDALSLDNVESILPAYAPSDAHHLTDVVQDFQENCSSGHHLCDAPLQSVSNIGQAQTPSQGDARARTHSDLQVDDQDASQECIHQHLLSDHLSKNSSLTRESHGPSLTSSLTPSSCEPQSERTHAIPPQSDPCSLMPDPEARAIAADESTERGHKLSSSSVDHTGLRTVVSITFERRDNFYDMRVPGALNYVAHGLVHHNTGIGKGRVVAGVIRYAMKSGRMPIFVTEKPNLYADMYRDMTDIGLDKMLGRPVKILMTDSGKVIPLDESGTNVLKSPQAPKHNPELMRIAREGGDHDVLFTTYSQMQSRGGKTPQQYALEGMAPGSILIFDESHNAGGNAAGRAAAKKPKKGEKEEEGDSTPDAPSRAQFARDLAKAAHGVFFSSATYAKRPDVMDLYSSTDMSLAVADIDKLGDAIAKGGIPMQQVVAANLAESGQYVRRERSFDGVEYNTPVVPVDRQSYESFTGALAAIQTFSDKYVATAVKGMDRDIKAEGKSITGDSSTGGAGVSSTNFTAIMHNLIDQVLLSMKAEEAAKRAIEAIQRGEKPVITLATTMGSFLETYVEERGVKSGDPVGLSFTDLMIRYLERSREISIRKPFSKEKGERHRLTDGELGESGVAAYDFARDLIRALDLDAFPISPIDHIRDRIEDAGYKVGEITGRSHMLKYTKDGPVYRLRPGSDKTIKGRLAAISGFNGGTVDAMILNQSGATGLSLHASATFKDKRPRRMIIAQAEKNIDTHMQMLGRIHRSGQVILPRYDQITADIPAEKRPTAVLAKKMASLNANTTGARDSALTGKDVPDFMNEYGDEIAARLMEEDEDLHSRLAEPLKESDKEGETYSRDGAARSVTGRLVLLPLGEQESFYDRFLSEYELFLAQKEAAGESALEAKTLELDARLVESKTAVGATEPRSPFGAAVKVETMDVKRLGRPFTPEQIAQQVADFYGYDGTATDPKDIIAQAVQKGSGGALARAQQDAISEFYDYSRTIEDSLEGDRLKKAERNHRENLGRARDLFRVLQPGYGVRLQSEIGAIYGIVTKLEKKGNPRNPLALSTWRATVALAESTRQIVYPLSQLQTQKAIDSMATVVSRADSVDLGSMGRIPLLRAFSEMQSAAREQRTIVTGNILAGFDHVKGKGQIINFTDENGDIRSGILMPRGYNYAKEQEKLAAQFRTTDQVVEWVNSGNRAEAVGLIVEQANGRLAVKAAAAKATGGQYYLNPRVRSAVGGDFVKSGTYMQTATQMGNLREVIEALRSAGAVFQATDNIEKAREIIGRDVKESRPESPRQFIPEEATDRRALAGDLRRRMTQLGIDDRIGLRVVERIFEAAGTYTGGPTLVDGEMFSGLIRVALGAQQDAAFTLNHEAIHAMKSLGLFRNLEWQALARRAQGDAALMDSIKRRYPNLDEAGQTEEAIADMFAGWVKNREDKGFIGKAFDRVLAFISALRSWAKGNGWTSAEDVMRAMDSGALAQRPARAMPKGLVTTEVPASQYSVPDAPAGPFLRDVEAREESEAKVAEDRATALVEVFGSEDPSTAAGGRLFDRWRTTLQDKMLPLLRTQTAIELATGQPLAENENPYLGEELMSGKIGAQLEQLADDMIEPLFASMKEEDVTVAELETYLYARHAPERNARIAEINPEFGEGEGSGMTDQEASEIMDAVAESGKQEALERLAAKVDAINSFSLGVRVRGGLLSKGEALAWKKTYEHYVPLRGREDIDEATTARPNRQSGISVRGKESKRAFGRRSKASDILAYTIMQAEEAITRAETNRVAQQFLELAQSNPEPEFWTVDKMERRAYFDESAGQVRYRKQGLISAEDAPFTISAKVEGREHRITMNRANPAAVRVADAMRNLTGQQLGQFARVLGAFTRFFSRINTVLNPEFVVTNAIRDVQTAGVTLQQHDKKGLARAVIRDWRKALTASKTGDGEWAVWRREFELSGGKMYFADMGDIDTQRKRIEALSQQGGKINLKIAATKALSVVSKLNDHVENAIRLSTYANLRRMGATPAKAASAARNVTVNFTRRGTAGPFINSFYAFFNAGVQGSTTLVRAAGSSKKVRAALAGLVAMGFLMDMLNRALTDDDDDGEDFWAKVPAYEKEKNFILMIPGSGDKSIKLPLGLGLNAFYSLGRNLSEMVHGRSPLEAGGEALATIGDTFNPLGSGSLLTMIMPTVLDPVAEIATNKNFADKPIQPEPMPFGEQEPASERYFASVSTVSRNVASWVNELTGGDEIVEGAVSVSPEVLDYMAAFFTGGVGRFVGSVAGVATAPFDAERELTRADIPFVRKVAGSKPEWLDKSLYFDRAEKIEQTVLHAKSYAEMGAEERLTEYANDNAVVLSLEAAAKASKKDMRAIRKDRAANQTAYDAGVIDREAYLARQQFLKEDEAGVVDVFNQRWNAALKEGATR